MITIVPTKEVFVKPGDKLNFKIPNKKENRTVYVLKINRYFNFSNNDSYVDSVHSTKEKAWKRIEEKFYPFSETVIASGYEVRDVIFRDYSLTFSYENFIEDLYGRIEYEIIDCQLN